LIVYFNIL